MKRKYEIVDKDWPFQGEYTFAEIEEQACGAYTRFQLFVEHNHRKIAKRVPVRIDAYSTVGEYVSVYGVPGKELVMIMARFDVSHPDSSYEDEKVCLLEHAVVADIISRLGFAEGDWAAEMDADEALERVLQPGEVALVTESARRVVAGDNDVDLVHAVAGEVKSRMEDVADWFETTGFDLIFCEASGEHIMIG